MSFSWPFTCACNVHTLGRYRNMCRYNSGVSALNSHSVLGLTCFQFFYRHELVLPYRWYWRVEPDVHFHCDMNFDPFLYMGDHNKTYGKLPVIPFSCCVTD